MRIVLDTNVLVAGLRSPRGPARRVVSLIVRGPLIALFDARIVAEYRSVVARPHLGIDSRLAATTIETLTEYGHAIDVPATHHGPRAIDPDDQPFLDVALAGGAAAIVTRNRADFPPDAGVAVLWPEDVVAWFTADDLRRWLGDV